MLLSSAIAVVAGFALLVWGADRFIIGASTAARNLGVSPLIVGLTVVGFGTSAPEMLVSAVAAWEGNPALGIGNAIGSNITNIGLVLGITALIAPLNVRSRLLRREFPVLLAIMAFTVLILWDGYLGFLDGILLVSGFFALIYWVIHLGLREHGQDQEEADPTVQGFTELEGDITANMTTPTAILWLCVGILILLGSSWLLVWGAVNIAQWAGVSDLVIGLTIIAIGTSLPELAASVMGALKNEHDIAIGNVLGSNMFNLLAVLGMPGIIHPGSVSPDVLNRDYLFMIGLTVALFAFSCGMRHRLVRMEGGLLLLAYGTYLGVLYYQSVAEV